MPRTAAKITQADIARVLRAIDSVGAKVRVDVLLDGTIRVEEFAPAESFRRNAGPRLLYMETLEAVEEHNKQKKLLLQKGVSGVYFVQAGELVKIGFASDFRNRLRDLEVGCPYPIKVLGIVPGTMSDEKRFHDRFKEYRMKGEWFWLCAPLLKQITALLNVTEVTE